LEEEQESREEGEARQKENEGVYLPPSKLPRMA